MSRSKSAKRKRVVLNDTPNKSTKLPITTTAPVEPQTSFTEPKNFNSLISSEELEITVETLQTLSEYPQVLKSKACKDLRVAVYDFKRACTTGLNTAVDGNLTARITAALTDEKYIDALVLLAEMRIRNETPKLGALCRWVRDLDVVSGLSMQVNGTAHPSLPRSAKDLELLKVLDSISRVTGPTDVKSTVSPLVSDPIALQETWNLRDQSCPQLQIRESVLDETIFAFCIPEIEKKFCNIETTPGPSRRPPNLHAAVVYSSSDDSIQLSPTPPDTTYHKHPIVPNLSIIKDVLSADECKSIVAATESIGFLPDAPIRDDGTDASVLAHNVYWVVSQSFHDTLWKRCQSHVPSSVNGRKARGINRRFRVYRYVPGAEYRVHVDGAWPPSGVHPITNAYQYDASPADAKQSSLFTFLIYLNDEFEGGETTFFLPSVRDGVMNAYPVNPIMGSVAVFPHGETAGALLHEGTGVRSGAKYVIRTDVVYDVEPGKE